MKEIEFIKYIKRRAGKPGGGVKAGIGDDCAVLNFTANKYLLWATDMLLDGTHFRLPECGWRKAGRKAVAVNVSDIVSMGGRPKYITVNLGLPEGTSRKNISELYSGIFSICRKYGIDVVGGDTNGAKTFVIDISIIGTVNADDLKLRSSARAGDCVVVTGPIRNGRASHLEIEPRVRESAFLSSGWKVNAMMDVSDGIGPDLSRMCEASGTGCILYPEDIPLIKGLSLDDALYYGESFELMFTMPAGEYERLSKYFKGRKKKCPYYRIGEMTREPGKLILRDKRGDSRTLQMKGYEHI